MSKPRRARRIVAGVFLTLVIVVALLGIKLRLGFGPKLSPPPLLSPPNSRW